MFEFDHAPRGATSLLALSCVGLIATATPAHAQTAASGKDGPVLGGMTITGTAVDEGVKVERVESPKATRPLLDTPQTITVIGQEVIAKQNLLTLRDVLTTIPGITFGAGEGGGGFGDSINLRGYSANNDITIDGVRDTAQYSRNETFNLQQVEVYNGANSVFNGSGSVGGTINLVTKVPQAETATTVTAGIGTDDYYRATIDSNVRVNELIAVRLNAVGHRNDYPGRDVEYNKRWAFAPSVAIGVESSTNLILSYVHQRDHNIPVYGVPYYRGAVNDGPLPGIDDSTYFGIANLDEQDIFFDQATARFTHDFTDKVSIRNLTRWQRVEQNTDTSAPQGTYCLANGTLPTGGVCTPANSYTPSGPRGNVRDTETQLLYNQTDLRAVIGTGPIEHTIALGAAFTLEDYDLLTGSLLRTATGVTVAQPVLSLPVPNTIYTGAVNFIPGSVAKGETRNAAVYLFDTTKFGDHFEVSGSLRYEHNRAVFRTDAISTTVGPTLGRVTLGQTTKDSRNLFSWRAGVNYKPIETISIYAGYGTSRVPTSASVRGGCGTLIAGQGTLVGQTLDPCDAPPEKAENYEAGIKADLFDRKLQLTAAVFRNDRTNYRVATNDPIVTTLPVPDGRSRVDGIALGASGNITEAWAVFANYTYLDSEVKQSISDFCLANPGPRTVGTTTTNVCGNSTAVLDPQAGSRLTQTPKHAGSLYTTYTLPFGLQLGYGLTYQSRFALNSPALVTPLVAGSSALTPVYYSRGYTTHRAFLTYEFFEGLSAQLNVQNLTNKRYFTGIRNNGWATPGEARAARFTLTYGF